MPQGTVLSFQSYPLIVMRDRVGVFIFEMAMLYLTYPSGRATLCNS